MHREAARFIHQLRASPQPRLECFNAEIVEKWVWTLEWRIKGKSRLDDKIN